MAKLVAPLAVFAVVVAMVSGSNLRAERPSVFAVCQQAIVFTSKDSDVVKGLQRKRETAALATKLLAFHEKASGLDACKDDHGIGDANIKKTTLFNGGAKKFCELMKSSVKEWDDAASKVNGTEEEVQDVFDIQSKVSYKKEVAT